MKAPVKVLVLELLKRVLDGDYGELGVFPVHIHQLQGGKELGGQFITINEQPVPTETPKVQNVAYAPTLHLLIQGFSNDADWRKCYFLESAILERLNSLNVRRLGAKAIAGAECIASLSATESVVRCDEKRPSSYRFAYIPVAIVLSNKR